MPAPVKLKGPIEHLEIFSAVNKYRACGRVKISFAPDVYECERGDEVIDLPRSDIDPRIAKDTTKEDKVLKEIS